MTHDEVRKTLFEIFDLGWRIGSHQKANQPFYDLESLKRDMAKEFESRDEKIKAILEQFDAPSL